MAESVAGQGGVGAWMVSWAGLHADSGCALAFPEQQQCREMEPERCMAATPSHATTDQESQHQCSGMACLDAHVNRPHSVLAHQQQRGVAHCSRGQGADGRGWSCGAGTSQLLRSSCC